MVEADSDSITETSIRAKGRVLELCALFSFPIIYAFTLLIAYFVNDDIPQDELREGVIYSIAVLMYFALTAYRWWIGKGIILFAIAVSLLSTGLIIGVALIITGGGLTVRDILLMAMVIALLGAPIGAGWVLLYRRLSGL